MDCSSHRAIQYSRRTNPLTETHSSYKILLLSQQPHRAVHVGLVGSTPCATHCGLAAGSNLNPVGKEEFVHRKLALLPPEVAVCSQRRAAHQLFRAHHPYPSLQLQLVASILLRYIYTQV